MKLIAIPITIFLLVILLLSIKYENENNSILTKEQVDVSIQKGLSYLNSIYNEEFIFDDDYLRYKYPIEELINDSNYTTAREIDAYIDLVLVKQNVDNYDVVKDKALIAETSLRNIIDDINKKPIADAFLSTVDDRKNGYGIELSCLLGDLFSDKEIAEKLVKYSYNGRWKERPEWDNRIWSEIADETWCISLLAKTHVNDTIMFLHLNKKINESYDFVNREDVEDIDKIAGVIHTVIMLGEIKNSNYSINEEDYKYFKDYLILNSYKFDNNNLMLANVVYALTKNDCNDVNKLNKIINKIIRRQKNNGVWYSFTNKEENYAQAFTTIRAVISLNQFKEKCL